MTADEATGPHDAVRHLLRGRRRLLVLAPHPDDEVLGCAGLMQYAAAEGCTVRVAIATDGEACFAQASGPERRELAARRRAESVAAAAVLGLPAHALHFGALGDGCLRARREALAAWLRPWLDADACVAAPWRGDGHPDHEAMASVVVGLQPERGFALCEYAIWAPSGRSGEGARWAACRPLRLPLGAQVRARKGDAVRMFASQLRPHAGGAPILGADVVARLTGPEEWFACS